MSVTDRLHALDRRQQQTRGVRFVAALLKKFGDDQGGQLAALIAYYAFVSLFPLLLVLVTVLGFVLQGNPTERQKILDGTLGQFPIISDYLKLHSLNGSPAALAIGIVGSLLAGHGHHRRSADGLQPHLARAVQAPSQLDLLAPARARNARAARHAGDRLDGRRRLRRLGQPRRGSGRRGSAVALAFNLALFAIAFRLLTAADLAWRDVLPGAIVAAILLAVAAAPRRLLRRSRAQAHGSALRHLRVRPRVCSRGCISARS